MSSSSSPLVSFLITLLLAGGSVCIQGQEPVKDTAGNSLETGQQYFIQPANTNGGGLVPASRIIPFCPLDINQALIPSQPGLPVTFAYADLDIDTIVVNTSTDFTIEFQSDLWPFCTEFSKLWEVDNTSPASEEPRPILIGGERGSGNSSFKIEKVGQGANTYKLTTFIGTVGTVPKGIGGAPKLVVPNDDDDDAKTLIVQFKKVGDATTATTSTSRIDKFGLIRMFPFY